MYALIKTHWGCVDNQSSTTSTSLSSQIICEIASALLINWCIDPEQRALEQIKFNGNFPDLLAVFTVPVFIVCEWIRPAAVNLCACFTRQFSPCEWRRHKQDKNPTDEKNIIMPFPNQLYLHHFQLLTPFFYIYCGWLLRDCQFTRPQRAQTDQIRIVELNMHVFLASTG